MSESPVEISDKDRVRTIAINRPDALNAMNNATFEGIRDGLAEAESDAGIAVVILTGKGRAFCAGADLAEMRVRLEPGAPEHQFPSMLRQVARFEKPLVAAVNGLGVGIGMTILAHCDLVLMASTARVRAPFPQLGLAPEAGSSFAFASVMGWQNAAYALLSGRWFSAAECLQMGLAWRVCEPDALIGETESVAGELSANPIPSLVATKKLMLDSGRRDQALAAHVRELEAYGPLMGGPANSEAVAAFLEKREPDFRSIPGI